MKSHKLYKFFSLIKESLKGEEMDYTTGSLRKAVFMLAIPMMLELVMESVFALVDLYFVGKLPDSEKAIQVVGLTEMVLTIVYSLAIGMSMAATAVVARRVGEKNTEAASKAAAQVLLVTIGVTLIISIAGFIYATDILVLMGATPATAAYGTSFIRIMMGGSLVILLLFLINGIFRGAGYAAIAMKSLWVANICNIILCPLLINGFGPIPGMGLTGAAIATTAGRGVGVVYQIYYLIKGNNNLKLQRSHWRPDKVIITNITKIATPAIFQFIIASGSWIVLGRLVAISGGETASAAYQTALRLLTFFILPAWGMSNAAATLVGQNLGAQNVERAQQSVLLTMKYNVIFMASVTFFFYITGPYILSFFTNDAARIAIAIDALRIISAGYIFYGIGMVMMNAFNGAGDTITPTWVNFFGFWLFQIPFAYLLADYFNKGAYGVFFAVPVAEALMAIASLILFKRGRWKKVKV